MVAEEDRESAHREGRGCGERLRERTCAFCRFGHDVAFEIPSSNIQAPEKHQAPNPKLPIRISAFGFPSDFGLRISDFTLVGAFFSRSLAEPVPRKNSHGDVNNRD